MNVQSEGRGARVLLTGAWSRSGGWRYLTAPAAWGYRAALAARRLGFAIGLLHQERVGVPVVSIGNITVGGTGKTPAALWLADALRRSGWHPAIVTRGYGGTLGRQVITVGTGGFVLATPDKAGDEAVLLADRFPGPVVAGADRVVAARTAVADHDADLIILDDGFQHWRLARDLDIVLIDGRTGFGNGALLPAGPLREPVRALRRAGAIVVTKALRAAPIADMVAHFAVDVPVFIAELVPRALLQVEDGSVVAHPLTALAGRRVVTVSGIAQPRSFYELLGQLDARSVEVLEFADHH
ncbi:MAG TPA: tetraacyldisaccharide 4'-kinase, partial [Candidatus Bathyarchaeia archaeon]|nr:tetraacyldisaccharide 4'-kinase [Candidatus Bathyarchaeia archaeon]